MTLNNAGEDAKEPQFYMGCIQVTIEGTTGVAKPSTVSIPGYVTLDSPGLLFDVWSSDSQKFKDYPEPGPKLFADSASEKRPSPGKPKARLPTTANPPNPPNPANPTNPASPTNPANPANPVGPVHPADHPATTLVLTKTVTATVTKTKTDCYYKRNNKHWIRRRADRP